MSQSRSALPRATCTTVKTAINQLFVSGQIPRVGYKVLFVAALDSGVK